MIGAIKANHAQHPILVHFPIGLFITSLLFDLLSKVKKSKTSKKPSSKTSSKKRKSNEDKDDENEEDQEEEAENDGGKGRKRQISDVEEGLLL